MEVLTDGPTIWSTRAERLLSDASSFAADYDPESALSSASAAIACLRIELGEMPEDEMEGFPFPGEEPDESACICSPNQRATGGFTSRCPVHGRPSA